MRDGSQIIESTQHKAQAASISAGSVRDAARSATRPSRTDHALGGATSEPDGTTRPNPAAP